MVPSLAKEALEGPFHLYHKQSQGYPFSWHYHNECELFVPLTGKGECLVGDFLGEYQPRQAFYLPPMLPHCFHTLESSRRVRDQESYVLFFARDSDLCQSLAQIADLDSLHRRWPGGVRLSPADTAAITNCLRKLYGAEGLARVAVFVEVISTLFSCRDGQPLAHPVAALQMPVEQTSRRMNAIGSYLHRHCAENVVLADVARAAHMSVPSLCRFFRHHTGKSVFRYLQELRLSRVCCLLNETSRPITEIALGSGYLTLSHFNRSFRAAKGMSPREYRKHCKSN